MPLPAGISVSTVTFGKALGGALGTEGVISGTVTIDRSVTWGPTGDALYAIPETLPEQSVGGWITFNVPHVDQPGFIDAAGNAITGFAFVLKASVRFPGQAPLLVTKPFQVYVGQTNVDLDLVPGGAITQPVVAPTATVTSVAGQTGEVSAGDLSEIFAVDLVDQVNAAAAAAGEASTAADAALAAAELASDISGIATPDGLVRALIDDPNSEVAEGLLATFVQSFMVPAATGVPATDTANWTDALNAAEAAGRGFVRPIGGNYAINAPLPAITKNKVSIVGDGGSSTVLLVGPEVVGDVLRWHTNPFATEQAGRIEGVIVDGASAGVGAVGIHLGDLVGGGMLDVVVRNFDKAGSVGLWEDNRTNWCERLNLTRVHVENCTTLVRYSVNGGESSFAAHRYKDLRLNANDSQTVFSIEDGAILYGIDLTAYLNAFGDTTFLKLIEGGLINGRAFVGGENNLPGGVTTRIDAAAGTTVNLTGHIAIAQDGNTYKLAEDVGAGAAEVFVGHASKTVEFFTGASIDSGNWQVLGYAPTIPAAAGDLIEVSVNLNLSDDPGDARVDIGILNGGALVAQMSTGAAPNNSRNGLWRGKGAGAYVANTGVAVTAKHRVRASEISGNTVQVAPIFRTTGGGRGLAVGADDPVRVEVTNFGGGVGVV